MMNTTNAMVDAEIDAALSLIESEFGTTTLRFCEPRIRRMAAGETVQVPYRPSSKIVQAMLATGKIAVWRVTPFHGSFGALTYLRVKAA